MPLDYPQRRQNLVYGGKSGFIGYLMIRPPGPWRMYWKTLEGLVLWYDFNQCQAIDLSRHGNNGTIYGAQCVQGRSGKALSFDGVDDYVEVPDSASLDITDEITIIAWMKILNLDIASRIVSKRSSKSPYDFLFRGDADRRLNIYFYDGSYSDNLFSDPNAITDNLWHLVAVVRNGYDVEFFVDDESVGTTTAKHDMITTDDPVLIGCYRKTSGWLNGIIDEVRIYNRALSEEEIKWLYEHT